MKRRSFLKAIGLVAAAPTAVMAMPKSETRFASIESDGYYESDPNVVMTSAEVDGNRAITIDEIVKNALEMAHKNRML